MSTLLHIKNKGRVKPVSAGYSDLKKAKDIELLKGIVYFEYLEKGPTINLEYYIGLLNQFFEETRK